MTDSRNSDLPAFKRREFNTFNEALKAAHDSDAVQISHENNGYLWLDGDEKDVISFRRSVPPEVETITEPKQDGGKTVGVLLIFNESDSTDYRPLDRDYIEKLLDENP